jgi:hypothetical protein
MGRSRFWRPAEWLAKERMELAGQSTEALAVVIHYRGFGRGISPAMTLFAGFHTPDCR